MKHYKSRQIKAFQFLQVVRQHISGVVDIVITILSEI